MSGSKLSSDAIKFTDFVCYSAHVYHFQLCPHSKFQGLFKIAYTEMNYLCLGYSHPLPHLRWNRIIITPYWRPVVHRCGPDNELDRPQLRGCRQKRCHRLQPLLGRWRRPQYHVPWADGCSGNVLHSQWHRGSLLLPLQGQSAQHLRLRPVLRRYIMS